MITIGELDKRITLYNATRTDDENYGGSTVAYDVFRTVWAKIEWKGGFEKEEGDKITGMSKAHFYVRDIDMSTFTLQSKIEYDSKNYFPKVINYDIDGRKQLIEIIAENKN